jgi:hypothetical protein
MYSAKREHTGNKRAPLYVSSIVLADVEPALNTCKLHSVHLYLTQALAVVGDSGNRAEDPDAHYNSDSDYDDAVERTTISLPEGANGSLEREPKPKPGVALSIGAFST